MLRPRLQWQSSTQGSWSLSPPRAMAPPDVLWPEVGLAMVQRGSGGWHSSSKVCPAVPSFQVSVPHMHSTSRTLPWSRGGTGHTQSSTS